jgi:deoxyribonuclease V
MQAQQHPWELTPDEAITLQERLRKEVILADQIGAVTRVAGVDASYNQSLALTLAAVAVLTFPELQLTEKAMIRQPTQFPYIPGLLSFREAPPILEALKDLASPPDLMICDGHGIAHPHRFGLACHVGYLTGIPTIGVAKRKLVGEHADVPDIRGEWQPIYEDGDIIGAALRTRTHVKPIYVSAGHKVCLETAIDYVMRCTPKYRLPETTRAAHRLTSEMCAEDQPFVSNSSKIA